MIKEKKMAENEEKEIEEVDEDDDVIILQDENGNEIKRKIAFTVRDDMLHVLFVYVFEDDEETVDVLYAQIDEDGNPTSGELQEIDDDSKYMDIASKYLNQYNQGTLMSHEDALKEDEELMKEATRTK